MTTLHDSTPEQDRSAAAADLTWLPVRPGEDPWTQEEFEEVQQMLTDEIARVGAELEMSEADIETLMRNDGSGSGDDSADAGGKVLEREHELTLAENSRRLLEQSRRALERLAARSYGRCEQCAEPIGKLRLQAFPRATLCVACKQKSERR
ncbi:TraR/DksA family transcriptional regulator [Gephyromycinifex aptenodytis]|uniref:TraR/DksA family transcriptional regulator n=1 Tax=Gephyromycinifex aptenodytis TaxID=2716227 RepID=UPI001447ADD1|nr:TraR/DksA family transcriptional regulator [Gephyromycinifex aptenodytis]